MRPLALWLGVGLLLVGDTEFEPDLDRAGPPAAGASQSSPRRTRPRPPRPSLACDYARATAGATGDEGSERCQMISGAILINLYVKHGTAHRPIRKTSDYNR